MQGWSSTIKLPGKVWNLPFFPSPWVPLCWARGEGGDGEPWERLWVIHWLEGRVRNKVNSGGDKLVFDYLTVTGNTENSKFVWFLLHWSSRKMKVRFHALKEWISAFSELQVLLPCIFTWVFLPCFFELGTGRLQVWGRIRMKPVLTCFWGQHFDVDPVLEPVDACFAL